MLKLFYSVFKDFGLDTVQLGIICFAFWKLATNHLKHMQDKINKIYDNVEGIAKDLGNTKERVSKIEGKIE